MKLIFSIVLNISILLSFLSKAAREPQPFDKFFKKEMKVTTGVFPVYQDGARYFMEISADALNQDILVVGDISKGFSNAVSQSSGVIRLSLGTNQNLFVTKMIYNEAVSKDLNPGMESLVKQSNLIPISYVIPIAATGKNKGSYIIEITRELMEGGDLFSFRDVNSLSRSDAARSGVQSVTASTNGVVFSVLRTQNDQGQLPSGKKGDVANAYLLSLTFQRLPLQKMAIREADPRIGFETISYNDFGKSIYAVKEVKAIRKWDIKPDKADLSKYKKGILVKPDRAINVVIDGATPKIYVPYIKQAVEEWNKAFSEAGFKDVLQVSLDQSDNWLSSGKILIKWGNAFDRVVKNTIEDPRTGEILAGKMNISDVIAQDLMPDYFVACGLKDERILKSLKNQQLKGEILRWKVTQAMGELLGMKSNLFSGTAFTTQQMRSADFVAKNSFASSITDDNMFNYVVQPGDNMPVSGLIPTLSVYDKLAIDFGYRIFANEDERTKFLSTISSSDLALTFVEENKNDPNTQPGSLASDKITGAELAMSNMSKLYPQIEEITAKMPNVDDDWMDFLNIANAFQSAFERQIKNVATQVAGQSIRPIIRGYNEQNIICTPKNEQQKAFDFLAKYLFTAVPVWMQNSKLKMSNNEPVENKFQRLAESTLDKMVSPESIGRLIKSERIMGKAAFGVEDLFKNIDHYIFKDFDPTIKINNYSRVIQSTLIYKLAQSAIKNSFINGLTEADEVMHLYFTSIIERVNKLSETHTDADTRTNYKLMKMKIEQEYLHK